MKILFVLLFQFSFLPIAFGQSPKVDSTAEKMILFQRNNGGWSQYNGNATNYALPISADQENKLKADKNLLDATIDDKSTTYEINYLMQAYESTGNVCYQKAAIRGIDYLLKAQNDAGGWPQWFPDKKRYHAHITYNDNAMVNVLGILKDVADGDKIYKHIPKEYSARAKVAVNNGIACILKTQYIQNGKLTVWCAQHDEKTLLPAKARAFELPSLSGNESVGIVNFLMEIDNPSDEIKLAIRSAVEWFELVKIKNTAIKQITAPDLPRKFDKIVVEAPGQVMWARFYGLDNNQPIFVGRDSEIKYSLAEVEPERRTGYAFYGNWPQKLLDKTYPAWEKKVGR